MSRPAPPPPQPRPRSRPILASIIAILLMIGAALVCLLGLLLIVASPFVPLAVADGRPLALDVLAIGVVILLIGALAFLIGLGLWRLRSWALWLVGIVVALSAVAGLATGGACALGFLIPLVLLIYFIAIRKDFD